jgi:hypothetical protein
MMRMNKVSVLMACAAVAGALGTVACESSKMPATSPGSVAGATDAMGSMDHSAMAAGSEGEIYMADLQPLNPGVGYRGVKGHAKFQIMNGMFVAMDEAVGTQPGMIHPQHIHAAAQCPTAAADVNHDGYVDVIEGLPFYGAILVPLDSDLSSQPGGTFPFVNNNGGALTYRQSVSLPAFLNDLNAPDPNPSDAVVKLNGEPLNLASRHVVLHGVALDTPLPSTVASLPGLPAQLTLPIACGEIMRLK